MDNLNCLSKKDLYEIANKLQDRADRALDRYQLSGAARDYNTYQRNDDLANAIRMTAAAYEESQWLVTLETSMAQFAALALQLKKEPDEEKIKRLLSEIASFGIGHELINSKGVRKK